VQRSRSGNRPLEEAGKNICMAIMKPMESAAAAKTTDSMHCKNLNKKNGIARSVS